MAGDLTKFLHKYIKNQSRYNNALGSLIDKYGETSDDELDTVVNLSSCKIIRDKKGFFSKENFASEKFRASKGLYKTEHQGEEYNDSNSDSEFDESLYFGKQEDSKFLQDVSTYMASMTDDNCEEPSDAETLSSSSSNTSYETIISDYNEIIDTHSDEETHHEQYVDSQGNDAEDNTYDEVDGDIDYNTSDKLVTSNLKTTDKNHNYRLPNETFTLESDDEFKENLVGMNQSRNILTNHEETYESLNADKYSGRRQEEFNDKSWCKYNSMNRFKTTLRSNGKTEPRNQQFAVNNERPHRRIQSNVTQHNEQSNKHTYEKLKVRDQGNENIYEKSEEIVRKKKDSDGKTNLVDNISRNKLNGHLKAQQNDLLPSPSRRTHHNKSTDRESNDRRKSGELLSPLQCRKVNIAKVSTKTNMKKLCDFEHEELSKKDSGISTYHDDSFAVSTPSHAELPEALTVQNLKQFNKSNMSDSTFFNISMNMSGLTSEKNDDVEKWLNKVSAERDKENDTSEDNNDNMMFADLQQKRPDSKQDTLTPEVKMASKKRLETSKKHEQHAYDKRNNTSTTDSRSHLVFPKSPKSMQYLRGISSPQKKIIATPDSERTKVKAHRSQKSLFPQTLNAQHLGEIMMKSGDRFSPRKKLEFIGKRSISHENDVNASDDESNVLPTPPKSRRISDIQHCSKSTQIDARCFTSTSNGPREILHSNTDIGISNRKVVQTDRCSYNIFDDSNNSNSSVYHGNSLQQRSNSFNQSALRSSVNYRNFETPGLSQSLQSSFQSPSHNTSYNIGHDYSYSNMENVNDDLICLNTYPAQSSVRKLNVSSKSRVRKNIQPNGERIVAGNLQRNGRHNYIMTSNDTSTDIDYHELTQTSDHNDSSFRCRQNSYTMCNFVDNPASVDRDHEMRRSSKSTYIPDTQVVSLNSSTNHSYCRYDDESSIQLQNIKSHSKQRHASLDNRINKGNDNIDSFNLSPRRGNGYLSHTIDINDQCDETDVRQFDVGASVSLPNEREPVLNDVRYREMNDRGRDYHQYCNERDDSEYYDPYTNVRSPRSPRQFHRLPSHNQRSPRTSKPTHEQKSQRQVRSPGEQRSSWQPRQGEGKSPRQPRSLAEPRSSCEPRHDERKSPGQPRAPGDPRSSWQSRHDERKSPMQPRAPGDPRSSWQSRHDERKSPRQPRAPQEQRSFNENNFGLNPFPSNERLRSNNLMSPSGCPHTSTSHRDSHTNIQFDPQHWNTDANSTPINDRRQFNMCGKTESSQRKNIRSKYNDPNSENFESFVSPRRNLSNQKPGKSEFMSPSSTSKQVKDDHDNFRSPTINRINHKNEGFSPSTSLAKMKLHTPKSGSKQMYIVPKDNRSANLNNNPQHCNSRFVERKLTDSGLKKVDSQQTFISLDQMQSNPLLFKIHLIDENQSDKSEERLRDCNDFSNNYWCEQMYDQQKKNDEREHVNPNDNVYHQYCDEIRDNRHKTNESRREASAWTDFNDSSFSPSKHSPKMKKSLFSSRTGSNSQSAIPHFVTKQKSPVFNDFKMPLSASVASKLKPSSHNNKENIKQSNRNVKPALNRDNQTISGGFADRLGGKIHTVRNSSNYMHSTPVKPGCEFTFNNTLSTILPGQDDTEIDEDKEEILLV
ncbi:hypothetical protein ACF0H5_011211 [Mactra antiquata]